MSDPYRAPDLASEASRETYEEASKMARLALAAYEEAKRCQREIWAPRIFAAVLGLGLAIGCSAGVKACVVIALAPAPCEEDAKKLDENTHTCRNGAHLVVDTQIVRCVCPREGAAQ